MGYRFVKITSFYRDFLNEYYHSYPEIQKKSYQEQFDHLMNQGYGYSDYFARHMREIGNEAYEIIYNAKSLQQAWAAEHNSAKSGLSLIIEQLRSFNAEVVLFQDILNFQGLFFKSLKEKVPSLKLLIGMCCSPYTEEHLNNFVHLDFMLGCSPLFTEKLNQEKKKTYLFYHSIEENLCHQIQKPPFQETEDVIFIGSFIGSSEYHTNRLDFIEEILNSKINLTIFSKILEENKLSLLSKKTLFQTLKILKKTGFKDLALSIPYIKKIAVLNEPPEKVSLSGLFKKHLVNDAIFGLDMLNEIARYKIGINIHGGIAGEYAANIRMFEVTGVGSCLVTDHKKNISDLFEPDKEIVTYTSAEECIEKIRWLLANPLVLKEISRSGQERTFKNHSVKNRVGYLDELIRKYL